MREYRYKVCQDAHAKRVNESETHISVVGQCLQLVSRVYVSFFVCFLSNFKTLHSNSFIGLYNTMFEK